MTSDNRLIQGLWVGDRLPTMQRLCIASFLANGHEFALYTYSQLDDVPAGTTMMDASEIVPPEQVFRNRKSDAFRDTFAAFSDFFRYKLLLDRGGWWTDVDVICLRPFDFAEDYVFASEHALCRDRVTTSVIKAPAGAPIMQFAWESCGKKDKDHLSWDEVGPDLLEAGVERFSLSAFAKPALAFCPLLPWHWRAVLEPERKFRFESSTYAIHLWHENWRRANCEVDTEYAPGCLYEQLKNRFLRREATDPRHNVFQIKPRVLQAGKG